MRKWGKLLWGLACVGLLAQCSTSEYSDALSTLNKGLASSQSNLATLDARAKIAKATAYVGGNTKLSIQNCGGPFPPKAKVSTKTPDCVLTANGVPSKTWEASSIPNGLIAMQALVDYGQGLSTLIGANDVTQVDSGLKSIDSAVSGAAKAAGSALPAGAAQYESLITFALGQIVEAQRVAAVQTIITTYAPTIDRAIDVLIEEARRIQPIVLEGEARELSQLAVYANGLNGAYPAIHQYVQQHESDNSPSDTLRLYRAVDNLIVPASSVSEYELINQQAALQALANTDASEPFVQLKKAHAALVALANGPQFSLASVEQALSAFASDADSLYSALHPATTSSTKSTTKSGAQ